MDRNKLFIGLISIVGIFIFLIAAYYATNKPKEVKSFAEVSKISARDHVKWSPSKKHVLVEYGDLQCPACQSFHASLKQIEQNKDVTNNITFVFRHFPLEVPHVFAMDSAMAAEAAGRQKKFFEMVDLLYENQETWSVEKDAKPTFRKYAEQLKLNMERYDKDVTDPDLKKVIQDDQASGTKFEVNATPTFYLDGVKLDVATFDEFQNILVETAKK